MKKIITAIAVISAMLFISGCSTSASPAPTVTVTEEPVQPTYTAEERYLMNVHSFGNVYIEGNTDSDLLDLGYAVCAVFDEGYSAEDVINELAYGVFGQNHAGDSEAFSFVGYIIGGAVKELCTEHLSKVQDLVYG